MWNLPEILSIENRLEGYNVGDIVINAYRRKCVQVVTSKDEKTRRHKILQ